VAGCFRRHHPLLHCIFMSLAALSPGLRRRLVQQSSRRRYRSVPSMPTVTSMVIGLPTRGIFPILPVFRGKWHFAGCWPTPDDLFWGCWGEWVDCSGPCGALPLDAAQAYPHATARRPRGNSNPYPFIPARQEPDSADVTQGPVDWPRDESELEASVVLPAAWRRGRGGCLHPALDATEGPVPTGNGRALRVASPGPDALARRRKRRGSGAETARKRRGNGAETVTSTGLQRAAFQLPDDLSAEAIRGSRLPNCVPPS